MANITGAYTATTWAALANEDHTLTGDVTLTLAAGSGNVTYANNLSGNFKFTVAANDNVFTMSGSNCTHTGLGVNSGTVNIANAGAFPNAPSATDDDAIALAGGTLEYTGATKHTLPAAIGMTVSGTPTLRLNNTTNTDNNTLTFEGEVRATASNTVLDLEGRGTLVNGSSNGTEHPSTVRFSGASTSFDATLNVRRGVTLDIDGVTFGSAGNAILNVYGDLRGNGTFTGGTMNIEPNGRILPGSLVDTNLNIIVTDTTNGLQWKKGSELWVSFDDDGVDNLNVTGIITTSGTGTIKLYNIAYSSEPLTATDIVTCSGNNALVVADFDVTRYDRTQIAGNTGPANTADVGASTLTKDGQDLQLAVA